MARSPRTATCRDESGFTLMELMIVVGLVAILMSILVVGVRQASDSFALRRSLTTAVSEIRRAQSSAIAEGLDYSVEFVVGGASSDRLRIYRQAILVRTIDATGNWPESTSFVVDAAPPSNSAALPMCTSAGTRNDVGSPSNACVWFRFVGAPDSVGAIGGEARPTGTVVLQSRSGIAWRIAVAAGTGRVSVQR